MAAGYKQSSGASGPATGTPGVPRDDPNEARTIQRRKALHEAWDAYDGHFQGPLGKLEGQPDLNVISNRIGPVVRGGVDFLFGPTLKMEHPTGSAQDILDAVWGNEDQRMSLLSRCRINGGVYGHVFVKLVTPKNKQPMSADNPPRLVVQNPELYDVETDEDNCDIVRRYVCVWHSTDAEGNPCQRMQTTTRVDPDFEEDDTNDASDSMQDDDAHWEIQDWTKADNGAQWTEDGPVMLWPYPMSPIVDWQNYPRPNEHWGAPDVDASVVNLNRNLHIIESNQAATFYSHGHPWLFNEGTGDTNGITPTPGTITDVPGGSIKAISVSGDSAGMANFAAQIRGNMDEETSTPGVATGRMSDLPPGQVSGITMHLLYGPRIMRTEQERRLYGQGIRDICKLALIVCGQEAAAEEDVALTWQDALPTDDLAMAQMAVTLQQVGLSKHTIFSLLGQNYDTEQEYTRQEQADQLTAYAQGQGMPPVMPGSDPAQAGPASAGATTSPGPSGQQGQPPQPGGNPAALNHPAAVRARQAMSALRGRGTN